MNDLQERLENLQEIVEHLRKRREEIEDQLRRTDIPPGKLVDWRVQVAAQLNVLDETIRRTLRRIRDITLMRDLRKAVKPLPASKVATMKLALQKVQSQLKATATISDIIKLARVVSEAAIKAGDAATPQPA
jgi:hypothetical protein